MSELAGAASLRNGCFNSSLAVAHWAGFVPVPGPGSPTAGGKPEGRREKEGEVKMKDKSCVRRVWVCK